jgi:chromosome segregation ATPase
VSTTPSTPDAGDQVPFEASPTPRWIPIAFVLLFILVAYLFYASHSSRQTFEAEIEKANQRADLLASQLEKSNQQMADLRGELQVTSEKLGLTQEELGRARALAQNIRKEEARKDEDLRAQLGQVRQESAAKISEVASEVSGAKSDLEATKKDLEATKIKLERTIGDLGLQSGLIARNREELEELKRHGERNVFEFDLRKSNAVQRVGPIQVALKKVDVKKNRYTMDVVADDKRVEKKDKTLNEPIQFIVRGTRVPYEIIVYELQKDRAIGYLTTPKEAATRQ